VGKSASKEQSGKVNGKISRRKSGRKSRKSRSLGAKIPNSRLFLRGEQEKENSTFLAVKGKSLGKEEQRSIFLR